MRLFFSAIVSVLLLHTSTVGQEPCVVGLDKAPMTRGIRLGMTLSEAQVVYPNISEPTERDEVGISSVYLRGKEGGEKLKGVESLFLLFFSGRIYHITAQYEKSYEHEVTELTDPLGLPNKDYARTECQGFDASIFRPSSNKTIHLDLTDTVAQRKIIELRSELEENAADCQNAPVIRGIKLGMTVTQFRTLLPSAQTARRRNEVGEVVLRNINVGEPRLEGIGTLVTYFLDGKLYFIVIDYTNQIEWKGIDEFVDRFSKATGLRTKWDGSFEDRTLRCHSFIVKAQMSTGKPRIIIQDRAAVRQLSKREEQLKSPANFRP
jgi:hypothetical protein